MADRSVNILIKARDQASSVFARVGASGQNLVRSLTSVRSLVATGLGFAGISLGAAEAIKGYAAQQEAETRLRNSLKLLGGDIDGNLDAMKAYASRLQSVTTLADDAALNIQALAINAGATVPQAQRLTRAAVDMAAALGIEANEAALQLTKTLGGTAGRLGQLIPELSQFTKEQLRAGAAIDLIAEKFRNAGDAAGSYERRWKQLINSIGDLGESVVAAIASAIEKQDNGVERLLVGLREAVDETTTLIDMLNRANQLRQQQGGFNVDRGTVNTAFRMVMPGVAAAGALSGAASAAGTEFFLRPLMDAQVQAIRDKGNFDRGITDMLFRSLNDREDMRARERSSVIKASRLDAFLSQINRANFAATFMGGLRNVTPEEVAQVQGNAMANLARQFAQSGLSVLRTGRERFQEALAGVLEQGRKQAAEQAARVFESAQRKTLELRARFGDEEAQKEVELLRIREGFAEVERELLAIATSRGQSEEAQLAAAKKLAELREQRFAAEDTAVARGRVGDISRPMRAALAPLIEGLGLRGNAAAFRSGGTTAVERTAKAAEKQTERQAETNRILENISRSLNIGPNLAIGVIS